MINILFDKEQNRSIAYDEEQKVGECNFIVQENNWNITHTVVNNKYQGQGIARKLVECVIENGKENNKIVIADCSYARKIIENK